MLLVLVTSLLRTRTVPLTQETALIGRAREGNFPFLLSTICVCCLQDSC